jgi:predicted deacetylase
MSATYLIRFDDICPTMDWSTWERIEPLLDAFGVLPIVSVIPDCRDASLDFSAPNADFWNRVRGWQAKGWCVAMHGYQHVYVTRDAGLAGIKRSSEFAGLPYREQLEKIEKASAIFKAHGIRPQAWVAPGHSFDRNTIRALRAIGLLVISDGLQALPGIDADGALWVPQQLWRFYALPHGVWTVCYHPSRWTEVELTQFRRALERYAGRIGSLPAVVERYGRRRLGFADRVWARAWLLALSIKRGWGARGGGSL